MDFKSALQCEVEHFQSKYGLPSDRAFLVWFAVNILEIGEDEAIEAISVEGANDKGIDLFFIDDDTGRVIIIQGKYSETFSHAPKERDISNLESSLNWLTNPEALEREHRSELAQASRDYLEAKKSGYGVELIYAYLGARSSNIDKKVEVYNQNEDNIEKNRVIRCYSIELLEDLWNEIEGGRRRIDQAEIQIVGSALTIRGKFGKAIVATVPCSEIVRLYNEHKDRLFDRNVRLFLGARKGSVNAGLANTIKSSSHRGNFWAYNNGITFICDQAQHQGNNVTITNFSIVNGCQTTVSLAENDGTAPELMVLVRFVAASAEIVDEVIQYTNSQNPIRTWDIASQDKTQRRLKTEFDTLSKPYIYLTRRGDKPSGNLAKYKDTQGKLRQIQIDVMGQYMAAFNGDPVLAYKHKALIFSRYHDSAFPPDVRVEEVLFCWICGELCKPVIAEMIKQDPDGDGRILKKGGTLFTLAVMAEVLRARNGATFLTTLTEEQIGSPKMRDRLKKYGDYSAMLYIQAFRDEAEIAKQELTTLVRQPEFIKKVILRAKRQHTREALNQTWMDGTLPKLGKQ